MSSAAVVIGALRVKLRCCFTKNILVQKDEKPDQIFSEQNLAEGYVAPGKDHVTIACKV